MRDGTPVTVIVTGATGVVTIEQIFATIEQIFGTKYKQSVIVNNALQISWP